MRTHRPLTQVPRSLERFPAPLCGWWLMSHHCIWGQDPDQMTEQGGRAENKSAGGSGTRNPRPVWECPPGPQRGARQHGYSGEGLLGRLLTENCLETADEISLSVCLYRTLSSEKTGTHGTHLVITSTQPRGGMPLMVSRCFGVKGKWAMKAMSREGVGSGGHGRFLGLVPWQWDGVLPTPVSNRESPGAKFGADGSHFLLP